MLPTLETPRLLLTPVTLADAARTQQIFPHWEIVRFLAAVPWPYPLDGAERYYADVVLPAMARGDEIQWLLRLKSSPAEHIGALALYLRAEENQRGFWLGLPWQGRGLMTEAVTAANDFWFGMLGRSLLRTPKAVANTASRRISEKTGMRLVATTEKTYVGGRMPSELWELRAEEWERRRHSLRSHFP